MTDGILINGFLIITTALTNKDVLGRLADCMHRVAPGERFLRHVVEWHRDDRITVTECSGCAIRAGLADLL